MIVLSGQQTAGLHVTRLPSAALDICRVTGEIQRIDP